MSLSLFVFLPFLQSLQSHGHKRSSSWGRTYSFSSAISRGILTEEKNRDVKAGIQPTLQVCGLEHVVQLCALLALICAHFSLRALTTAVFTRAGVPDQLLQRFPAGTLSRCRQTPGQPGGRVQGCSQHLQAHHHGAQHECTDVVSAELCIARVFIVRF